MKVQLNYVSNFSEVKDDCKDDIFNNSILA